MTYVDHSRILKTSGQSELVIPKNKDRKAILLQGRSGVLFNFGAPADNTPASFSLQPGQILLLGPDTCGSDELHAVSFHDNSILTAKEGV